MEESNNPLTTDWLILTADCFFRPGAGEPWEERKSFTQNEILNHQRNVFKVAFFEIVITEKTSDFLKGYINFDSKRLGSHIGDFTLDREHPCHSTGYLNVAYDTNLRFTLELVTDKNP